MKKCRHVSNILKYNYTYFLCCQEVKFIIIILYDIYVMWQFMMVVEEEVYLQEEEVVEA